MTLHNRIEADGGVRLGKMFLIKDDLSRDQEGR